MGVLLRYRAFFDSFRGKLDGSWSFEDKRAAYVLLEGLAQPKEAGKLAAYLFAYFKHFSAHVKHPNERVLLIVDEFPAIQADADAAGLVERLRSFGCSVALSAQSFDGLGKGKQRIISAARSLILHSCPEAEEVIKLAGTVPAYAVTTQIDSELGPQAEEARRRSRGSGSIRISLAPQGDTEWVVLLDAIDGLVVSRFDPATGALVPVHVDALPALKVGGPASAGFFYEPKDPMLGIPLLYVSTGKTGLQIFDVADPAQPVQVGAWSELGLAEIEVEATKRSRSVYAASEYWFGKNIPPEVVVLDASDLGKVTERRRLGLGVAPAEGNFVQGMALSGDRLYVAHSSHGLVVFDSGTGKTVRSYRPTGKRNEMAGVLSSPYAIDVELVGRSSLFVTDAALGTLTSLPR